jgi:hypothetical protein
MRKYLLKRGLIFTTIGTILMLFGTLTGNTQTTTTNQNVYNNSHTYPALDIQEYETTTNLQPGTYELQYTFVSTQAINQYYVIVLDPDGSELTSILGPPPTYHTPMKTTFQTQRAGLHTFKLGGMWTTVQITIDKQTPVVRTTYPYEITIYLGIALFTAGVPLSLLGASIREKRQPQWYD